MVIYSLNPDNIYVYITLTVALQVKYVHEEEES